MSTSEILPLGTRVASPSSPDFVWVVVRHADGLAYARRELNSGGRARLNGPEIVVSRRHFTEV